MTLDKKQILEFLPQRSPFLMVDGVTACEPGRSIESRLFLDPSLPFFAGHFPGNPIMPGVLIVESMAQTCGLLTALTALERGGGPRSRLFYLASNNVKFTSVVRAGAELRVRAQLVKEFQGLAQFSAEAFSGRESAARGTVVLAAAENARQ